MLIVCTKLPHITKAHSDTNTADDIAREAMQTKDQKQIIPDTLQHNRQETIRSYATWSINDNSVDRQSETQYESIKRPDYIDENDTYRQEQKQIQKAMTQDTPVKSVSNYAYIDNIIVYDKEVQRISKAVHTRLDLGQISLLGAQLYTTGRPAIDIRLPEKDII